jgi:tetratricopeptide (TPR) repeat protein
MNEQRSRSSGSRRRRTHGEHRSSKRKSLILWSVVAVLVVLAGIGLRPLYHWLKAKRAEQFATAGDAFARIGKLNEAAKEYRAALQLDPLGYHGLEGAARLATRADRPEAVDLWEQVAKLPQCTVQDRQQYAQLLLKLSRSNDAKKVIDGLLKSAPDTKTLGLASSYETQVGDKPKALEFARLAVERAPNEAEPQFQLAVLLARSTKADERAEARKILWELAGKEGGPHKQMAIEALARAPELSGEERGRVLQALENLTSPTVTDALLAADLRLQLHPENAEHIFDQVLDRWRNGKPEQLVQVARWLNVNRQPERVFNLFSLETALNDNRLLLCWLDALASLQRWKNIDDVLARPEVTLDPSVAESFRARVAQERNALLDADVHWNHAISLAGNDPFKLQFVANFAEQSHAEDAALKAYQQLARFPEQARAAYLGIERVSQRAGDAAAGRSAAEKMVRFAPDDPNAVDQLAYMNLLLNEDVEKNLGVAKQLAEKYPQRLSFRVTAALGYLRQHDPGSALAVFKGPVPIDWKRTQPAWRAVYAAVLLANDRNDEARDLIETIPLDQLNPQERALIEPPQQSE